jgi:hypothetical protein
MLIASTVFALANIKRHPGCGVDQVINIIDRIKGVIRIRN